MSKVIRNYAAGKMSSNDFRSELAKNEVKVDAELDKMIRKHDAGDFVQYKDVGPRVFRQMNGSDDYNYVDKINMNNPNIVSK